MSAGAQQPAVLFSTIYQVLPGINAIVVHRDKCQKRIAVGRCPNFADGCCESSSIAQLAL
jgi:hypothetical protein